jgi:hypothetical protein
MISSKTGTKKINLNDTGTFDNIKLISGNKSNDFKIGWNKAIVTIAIPK